MNTDPTNGATRQERILGVLQKDFGRLFGIDPKSLDVEASFVALGADSLFMLRASQLIEDRFGAKVPFRQLMESVSTLGKLAVHLDGELPADRPVPGDAPPPAVPAAAPATPAAAIAPRAPAPVLSGGSPGALERILGQQLRLMEEQLEMLRASRGLAPAAAPAPADVPAPPSADARPPARTYVAHQAIDPQLGVALDERQKSHMEALIGRLRGRVAKSRSMTAEAMPVMADSRTSSRFRIPFKDVGFQILVQRAEGAHVWDVDGNEYVDLSMGFGALLYGHSPPFLMQALHQEVDRGIQLGPQSRLGGEVAGLICELTGVERVCFFNSGTEAVMTALRLARAVTGRDKVILFAGSYHGTSDSVLVRGSELAGQPGRALPMAPGVPGGILRDTLVFEYGSPEALEAVHTHASELAAVLIEPRQTRRPDLELGDYLHQLRRATEETGTALIFDEVVTGFRTHPGGAQALFGVQADLVTYGKALGGGMPIGAVAGKALYMDAVDGGAWRFGDASYPQAEITIVRGTYFKHPLVMAGVRACLRYLKSEGPQLQERLNERTAQLARTLNAIFERHGVGVHVEQFSSLFLFNFPPELRAVDWDLFFFHLLEKGVYVWENRVCYLCTSSTEEDVAKIVRAVEETVAEMLAGGFLGGGGGTPAPGRPRERDEPETPAERTVALSPAQQELWFLTHLSEQASQAYNEPLAFLLQGPLQVEPLRRALQRLSERHEALRISFSATGDGQRIQPRVTMEIPFVDLAGHGEPRRRQELEELLKTEGEALFDLHRAPLLRARVVRLAEQEHVLAVTLHHTISDGWSNGVLIEDLRALYADEIGDADAAELAAPQQLSDFVGDQAVDETAMAAAQRFWLEEYQGEAQLLELPSDRPRPPAPTYSGVRERQWMPAELLTALKAAGRERSTTLFLFLFAGFRALMHRLSGQRDLVLGSLSAGQTQSGATHLMGYFLNILPLRCRLDADPPFDAFLADVRRQMLQALEHQGYPISSLIGKLDLDLGRRPLVTTVFNLDPPLLTDFDFAGLRAEVIPTHHGCSRFELSINAAEHRDRLALDWEYNTDLFDRTTVHRFMRHFETLLSSIVGHGGTRLSELEVLTAPELHQLRVELNSLPGITPAERCLHEAFEERAREQPDAVAVISEDREVSYYELERRSNHLAHELAGHGVGPETVVALCLERSVEMVVAVLAVLKAGGAYLPLDPKHPRKRLDFLLQDAGARVLVSRAGGGPEGAGLPVVAVDASGPVPDSPTPPPSGVGAANLAYVIYTSGSTGEPKGVMISHRAILNRVRWTLDAHPLTASDRLLMKTPYVFDASVWELMAPLHAGAALVLARPDGHQDTGYLARLAAEKEVSVLQLVPSLLQVFLEQPEVERCVALRRVLCGGEALPNALHRRLRERLGGGVELVNLYGPTEASIDICSQRAPRASHRLLVPIGRPVANTCIYLLDAAWRTVPPGVVGELYADGLGVARGYLNRPATTAEKFLPNPYGDPGSRVLRTGDLARYLADGAIEFVGRRDHQVKLRGFRIELGEVEETLNRHHQVREAVVVYREEDDGDARLVGYFVAQPPHRPSAEALSRDLGAKLPEYMVPSVLVELEALPRTPGGKLDRRRLPDPAPLEVKAEHAALPRTPIEEILLDLFADILKVERLGIHDSFLDLGGHSLLAVRLFTQIQKILRVQLALGALFESPTVAGLAQAVEKAMQSEKGLESAPLVAAGKSEDEPRILSFDQQRLWFLNQLEPGSSAYNLMAYVRFGPDLDVEVLERALAEIVRRQHCLRTFFSTTTGEPMQVVEPAGPVRLEVFDLSELSEAEELVQRERLAMGVTGEPFDLEQRPALRFHLFRLRAGEHVLLLTLHHIVADGWSTGVLIRELDVLYKAYGSGRPSPLPELAVQYADYAEWQRGWLRGEVLEAHLRYWDGKLRGAPEVVDLPTDRPRPPVQTYRGALLAADVSAERAGELRQLSRQCSVTLFMTMLGAFYSLLHRYGAGDDVVVGTHVANRGRPEIEGLIGFFVNSLVLRTDLGGDPDVGELLARTSETALDGYAHQDLPFDRVVEHLQPRRDLSVTPLYQVAFDFDHGEDTGDLETTGMPLLRDSPTAKFDLNLTVGTYADGRLSAAVEYSTDLFDPATIERFLVHYQNLLAGMAADPSQPLSRLPLLSPAEESELRQGFQAEKRSYPVDSTIHELFSLQAQQTPGDVAAVCRGEAWSYRELDRRSNRIAATLRRAGLGAGGFAGLLTERSLDFVAGLLAILKCGGAYVPIEPEYPEDRRRYMLGNSGVRVLLTRSELLREMDTATLAQDTGLGAVLCFDDAELEVPGVEVFTAADVEAASDQPPPPAGGPLYPAYMLYTSGSTGLPKGTLIRHDGAVNHIFAQFEALGLDSGLSFLQSAPSSSDISVWQFLAPLLIGGRTVIVDMETVSDAERLWQVLRDERITIVEPVPAVLRSLIEHVDTLPESERALPALQWMMATGEAVPVELVDGWLERYPDIRVINAYGPTEASDDVAQSILDRPLGAVPRVPIGRPLHNVECHVLDLHLRRVPAGVPGELCVGGIAVGSGYWRDPRKTSLAFVPNPLAENGGERLYRTGDRVRWLADGNLEFFGRFDHQVKVRGFRIELGEVEAALGEHPALRQAVALAQGPEGAQELVAYLVPRQGEVPEPGALRDFLRPRLPEHMIPSGYVALDELPLTPAGKVDRRTLARTEGRLRAQAELVAPRTPAEASLAEIWKEVLDTETLGVETDFFELGGHSLLAARVLARIRLTFEVEIPLRKLFELTTIAGLAAFIEKNRESGAPAPRARPIQRRSRQARRVREVAEGVLESP